MHPYSNRVRSLNEYTPLDYVQSVQHTGRGYVRVPQVSDVVFTFLMTSLDVSHSRYQAVVLLLDDHEA